ncbi:hypothetical protein HZB94_02555 [Candidatus Falkowbacteria bacterium]|nr:hypothetical protein [Candidatus Falkowbacteria bacterium]
MLVNKILNRVQDDKFGSPEENLAAVAKQAGLEKEDPRIIVARFIKWFLGIIGAIAFIIVLYGGYTYMTSAGDPEKVRKAEAILKNGVIGLIIIFAAYSITVFVFNMLSVKEPSGTGLTTAGSGQLAGSPYGLSKGAFGTVIQSQYPLPEQTGVPRNTMILVTFKAPFAIDSLIDVSKNGDCPKDDKGALIKNCGAIKTAAFRVYQCADMLKEKYSDDKNATCFNKEIFDLADESKLVSGYGIVTEDSKTIIFNPYGDSKEQHLGNEFEDVPYIVYLTGKIMRQDNPAKSIFTTQYPDHKWRFTTSTILDLTPPKVSSVVPANVVYPIKCPGVGCADVDSSGKVYLNQMVYIHFNEPVIPPLTQTQDCTIADDDNEAQLVNNKKIGSCLTMHVPGKWKVGINGYQTIQFIPTTPCEGVEKNSCGNPVYCLPANSQLIGKALAAKIVGGVSMPGTGIMDMAANSLDGNGNGKSDGPGPIDADPNNKDAMLDSYFWDFITGDKLDLIAPWVTSLEPNNNTAGITDVNLPLSAMFSESVDAYSVDTEIKLTGYNSDGKQFDGWFDPNLGKEVITEKVGDKEVSSEKVLDNKAVISHGPFEEYIEGPSPLYTPVIGSEVKDTRQNCFSPTKDGAAKAEETTILNSECGVKDAAGEVKIPGVSCCPQDGTYKLIGDTGEECTTPCPTGYNKVIKDKKEECIMPKVVK